MIKYVTERDEAFKLQREVPVLKYFEEKVIHILFIAVNLSF